jgi:hypothetical protein
VDSMVALRDKDDDDDGDRTLEILADSDLDFVGTWESVAVARDNDTVLLSMCEAVLLAESLNE